MPPKRTSSRARRSKQLTEPRRSRVLESTTPVADPPATWARSKTNLPPTRTRSKANPPPDRTSSTTNAPTSPGPTISRGPQAVTSSTPRSLVRTANGNTPSRRGAAGTPSAPSVSSRNSRASYTPQTEISTASPRAITQPEMDAFIESELHNAIFHDPNFVETFLSGAVDKLKLVEEHCRANHQHYNDTHQWPMPERVPTEEVLYGPIISILNTIKRAVDHIHPPSPSPAADHDAPDEPPQLFLDGSSSVIRSDLIDAAQIKPDLVLFQDGHRHWENVRIPIEVKTTPGLHKAGLKQLSRYARATFAHQLHRRHLYGMIFCRTEATFVRFDRAGVLYSKRFDLVKDAEAFTRAFASLLMLDRIDEGYDPAFTFERDEDGRLIYYIDLPQSAFAKTSRKSTLTGRDNDTRRFKVTEILCHRESICGRATIVLRIREELEVETQDPKEYALKIIWRDPERGSEGEVLGQIHGRFGLAQSIWHFDVSIPGKCQCPAPVEEGCTTCVDRTVQVDGLQVCDKLRDINIVVPLEGKGEEQVEHVDTTNCRPTSHVRPLRIYSYILMESVGVPLRQAESPRRFLTAVLDAILGYWGAFNLGIMHRDISDGNVLMLDTDQELSRKEWLEPRTADSRIQDPALIDSEAKLRLILEEIGHRDPTGMLSDFDLYAMHSSISDHAVTATNSPSTAEPTPTCSSRRRLEEDTPLEPGSKRRKTNSHAAAPAASVSTQGQGQNDENEPQTPSQREKRRLIDFRTGTPAFMSICVLGVNAGTPYHHHFFDDLESFFWLTLWSVAAHLNEGKRRPTSKAQTLLNELNRDDFYSMSVTKRGILAIFMDPEGAEETLDEYANEWALDPMFCQVLTSMGAFLSRFTSTRGRQRAECSPGDVFTQFVRIFLDALGSGE
ncbi:unnamed protein product [Rhizoctonia solani]|uniref:Fungal-type protein kinase domain-containing protein n=1 Tax=Rhizoctonia solani TaxID=456999 RepID=A0A8H3D1B6_9AGAM|nr:unnamed protein product [Rhizoctonia solani]